MLWTDFYDGFWDWSDSTRRTRISSLEDMGSGEEIVEVIFEIEDPKVRSQLIRKAMKMGATFTSEDFVNLDGELTDELYEELGKYTGFDHNDPYFDEDNMEWDDFFACYSDWSDDILLRRIRKLKKFGPSEEVAEAIQCMPNSEAEDLLYKKAVTAGVKFTREEKEELGHWDEVLKDVLETELSDEAIDQFVADAEEMVAEYEAEQKTQRRIGFWGTLIGLLSGFSSSASHHDNGRCNGDCANCPPHYGYRYGRWYYGHGHQWGCERHGNGGRTGKTYRD